MSTVAGRCDDAMEIKVNSRKLSQFLDRDVDLLKMDIEGAEEDVLHELATSGKLRFVKRMHVEYHHHIDPRKNALSRILKILEDNGLGYQIRTIPAEWPTATRFQDIAALLLPNRW